ncbi:hypothetical protein AVEN_3601-1 [Araneus ventricosus]|uniref:Reverse transcriptase domain-containing protein n=1 Tax=Araneus ventricosus TaxID=182803 RepID=A0A4Y2FNA3_ARAVE|nr:hypothetical protein AVEN_3601-1 [Araneus ventricosus]
MPHLNLFNLKFVKSQTKFEGLLEQLGALKTSVVKEIYLVVTGKILTRVSEIWYSDKVEFSNKLLQTQRSPLLSIAKAYSTASTDALHVLSGCPPLDLKIRTDVAISQHIHCIKNSRDIGDLQSFDFVRARKPWDVVRIEWHAVFGFETESRSGHRVNNSDGLSQRATPFIPSLLTAAIYQRLLGQGSGSSGSPTLTLLCFNALITAEPGKSAVYSLAFH